MMPIQQYHCIHVYANTPPKVPPVGRSVEVENLIDAQGIADRLGLAQRQTISSFVSRYPDFPKALGMWGRTRLWDWTEVEAWARQTGRYPKQ